MRRGRRVAAGILVAMGLGATARAQAVDPSAHWPLPPAELERLLGREDPKILSVRGGVGGVMGVLKLRVAFQPSGRELDVKWKKSPPGDADGWNNSPRKEIAAYQIQKWFLDPPDYVVPTTVVRCLAPQVYAPIAASEPSTLPGTRCVAGVFVIWLEEVTVPKVLYEEPRFRDDPLYARHMADFNLLTYLVDHTDGREGNFLTSELESERRVFSIDNGVTFGALVHNFMVPNWNVIRVPALRKETVERLRKVGPSDYEALGVVAELRADGDGVLRAAEPTPNRAPRKGARVADGWIQLGLEADEIAALRRRVEHLLADVDAGRIATF
jgi:hypothetical protein